LLLTKLVFYSSLLKRDFPPNIPETDAAVFPKSVELLENRDPEVEAPNRDPGWLKSPDFYSVGFSIVFSSETCFSSAIGFSSSLGCSVDTGFAPNIEGFDSEEFEVNKDNLFAWLGFANIDGFGASSFFSMGVTGYKKIDFG